MPQLSTRKQGVPAKTLKASSANIFPRWKRIILQAASCLQREIHRKRRQDGSRQRLLQTAGKTILKLDLIDTLKCGTHSNVVIEEKYSSPKTSAPKAKSAFPGMEVTMPADGAVRPILFGVRLKVENDKISEIETIVAPETEFAFNAAAVLATKDQDW